MSNARRRFSKTRVGRNGRNLLLGCLLVGSLTLLSLYGSIPRDNGSGGSDWKIGQPQVFFTNAFNERSLPQLSGFALQLVNRDRQLNQVSPLVEDLLLSRAAQLHAEDMLKRNFYDHLTPEGKTPSNRFAALGGVGGVGENIMFQQGMEGSAMTFLTLERFQKGWMYSEGHRTNLLTPKYRRFGFGIAADPLQGKIYAVQKFAE